jgi:hypothetical protein
VAGSTGIYGVEALLSDPRRAVESEIAIVAACFPASPDD